MHIHILGICGTFMGSLAILARELGHTVTGCDQAVYPPMSTQLAEQGIDLVEGYDPVQLNPRPDMVVIGNAMSRGNPLVEAVLDTGLPYMSGPEWLSRFVLQDRWTLAVSGTHGKTTTSTMLAWILESAGMAPGFLIGGVPKNFDRSARLGETPFFVIEADEYDSAFFDKRSKFVHYRPRTLIFNNLEFDHADIFPDLAAIQTQFHHLLRTVPHNGLIIAPSNTPSIEEVIKRGCWTPVQRLQRTQDEQATHDEPNTRDAWAYRLLREDGSVFEARYQNQSWRVEWDCTGIHNVNNGVMAMAAARHVGVLPEVAARALSGFGGVKRRMERVGEVDGIKVYDDFAHHPTAIETTLAGLRHQVGEEPIIAVIEPRSNTMKMGVHRDSLLPSAELADSVVWGNTGNFEWLTDAVNKAGGKHQQAVAIDDIVNKVCDGLANRPVAHVVVMSNGGFGGIHPKLLQAIRTQSA